MQPTRPHQPLGFLMHFILFLGCVGLPAFITMIAPVCAVKMEREAEHVTASVQWNCFFVIPFHRRTVTDVTGVDDHVIAGQFVHNSNRGPGENSLDTVTEDQGFLVIHGKDEEVKVPVSPENLSDVQARAKEFLQAKNGEPHLRLTTVANWKFGVIAGGLLTFMTVIYFWTIAAWWLRRGKPQPEVKPWRKKY